MSEREVAEGLIRELREHVSLLRERAKWFLDKGSYRQCIEALEVAERLERFASEVESSLHVQTKGGREVGEV